ncbi:hypothetical protein [Sporosarcina luteola]|uniref:hypothetical protein n=1 Tax=Sporosarcina luteola TaxID=582850 RepID=UPI00204093C7|nr:hypothetical protein [Sporosarcina luteola]MCM3712014.1 hypothetical protein [Sporosarcina luteola]
MKRYAERIDRNNSIEKEDLKHINSMIESMTYSMEWMTNVRQPGVFRGMDKKSVYQRRSYGNIDLIPDIAEQLLNS